MWTSSSRITIGARVRVRARQEIRQRHSTSARPERTNSISFVKSSGGVLPISSPCHNSAAGSGIGSGIGRRAFQSVNVNVDRIRKGDNLHAHAREQRAQEIVQEFRLRFIRGNEKDLDPYVDAQNIVAIQYLATTFAEELERHLNNGGLSKRRGDGGIGIGTGGNNLNFGKRNSHHHIPMHMMRSFSTTSSSSSENQEKDESTKNITKETGAGFSTVDVVDKDFTDYLTGKMDDSGVPSIDLAVNRLQSKKDKNLVSEPTTDMDDQPKPLDETSKPQQSQPQSQSLQSTDEWFNRLLSNRKAKDLGRPKPEVNETYRDIERANVKNIEKLRSQQVKNVRRALGGNVLIASSKLAAFLHSGSSAMLSEFIHSVVDCGNQSLLLLGLRDAGNEADRTHPYGYGKSIYFWALVSALGTFFLGAGVSMTQAIPNLIYGHSLEEITWHVWGVLGTSFAIDGYVFTKTLMEVNETRPKGMSLWKHVWGLRDPATLAILLEDGAACLGVVMAIGGIGATQYYQMPVFDALAGVGISALLASMGLILVRVNHRFLLGQSVDKDIRAGIEKILLDRRSIDNVHSIQSQWTGPETFSFKAEVDFDGTFLAAKLIPRYQEEFALARATLDQDLRVLLSWYAEDVMRTVEREVRNIEAQIRREYPGAQYIELEPMSKDADRFAIDDGLEASLKRIEIEALNRYLRSLYQPLADANSSSSPTTKRKGKNDAGTAAEAIDTSPTGNKIDKS